MCPSGTAEFLKMPPGKSPWVCPIYGSKPVKCYNTSTLLWHNRFLFSARFTHSISFCAKQQWMMSVGLSDDDALFSCSVWRWDTHTQTHKEKIQIYLVFISVTLMSSVLGNRSSFSRERRNKQTTKQSYWPQCIKCIYDFDCVQMTQCC